MLLIIVWHVAVATDGQAVFRLLNQIPVTFPDSQRAIQLLHSPIQIARLAARGCPSFFLDDGDALEIERRLSCYFQSGD